MYSVDRTGALDEHIRERLPAPNFWHLATVGPDGAPQVSPLWVDLEGDHVVVDASGVRADGRLCRP